MLPRQPGISFFAQARGELKTGSSPAPPTSTSGGGAPKGSLSSGLSSWNPSTATQLRCQTRVPDFGALEKLCHPQFPKPAPSPSQVLATHLAAHSFALMTLGKLISKEPSECPPKSCIISFLGPGRGCVWVWCTTPVHPNSGAGKVQVGRANPGPAKVGCLARSIPSRTSLALRSAGSLPRAVVGVVGSSPERKAAAETRPLGRQGTPGTVVCVFAAGALNRGAGGVWLRRALVPGFQQEGGPPQLLHLP